MTPNTDPKALSSINPELEKQLNCLDFASHESFQDEMQKKKEEEKKELKKVVQLSASLLVGKIASRTIFRQTS